MTSSKRLVRIIVLGNAAAGAEKQAIALSSRLRDRLRKHPVVAGGAGTDGVSCVRVPFHSDSIAHKLPPLLQVAAARLTGNAFFGYDLSEERKAQLQGGEEGDGDTLKSIDGRKPPLNVVIGSGRTTVALCATLKLMARRPGDIFNIQIQHPRVPLSWFDAVVAPRHDFTADAIARGNRHVHLTTGTVHDISNELLAQQAEQWREELAKYTQNRRARVVWLIGGPCRGFAFTEQDADAMAKSFVRVLKSKALGEEEDDDLAVFVTFSRRTPTKAAEIILHHLRSSFTSVDQLFIWDGRGENPYYAFLGVASLIVTTPDSISMTTEAIASTKAVFTISTERAKGKFLRFHQGLFQAKLTAPFTEEAVASVLQRSESIAKAHAEKKQLLPSEALERELGVITDAIARQIIRGM